MTATQLIISLLGLLVLSYFIGGDMAGQPYEDVLMKYANAHLPIGWQVGDFYNLIRAVITKESNWNANIVGVSGDIGLMQINPINAPAFNVTPDQLFNVEVNVSIGTSILRDDINAYGLKDGLAAYNGGPKNRNATVTQAYARDVINIYNNIQASA